MMTVLLVGLPEGPELLAVRQRVQSSPHFRVIGHAQRPDTALAQARVLLPDIAVVTRDRPGPLGDQGRRSLVQALRAFDPPTGIILRRTELSHPIEPELSAVDGSIHHIRRGDADALQEALLVIGRRRATCATDPDSF
ncbi:hypothetical protein [Streptomyces sp. TBY4]|uniref:hypothetical protein n=1 Tax=Streptomyces sp. TBY4 TaxID=2962030 RepID=UPI0020B8550E|nr:hypothetical protein [Streptomyces sp. TBY4]MCP3759333.1 hypothetical protein [Streptomyces sp. TBY4]